MSTSRKLDEIAANLDDMSITVEEIKEHLAEHDSAEHKRGVAKIEQVQNDLARAADVIDEALTREPDEPDR